MEFNEFSWERQQPLRPGAALSSSDIETIAKLMAELRELTLSRGSYKAASDLLERFGYAVDASALVRPEQYAS